ncbi:hypothetical protein CORC01_02410 [Colletotrichum orchidophilum]|uniref:Uncharacterized protein n=1 Tax=Colletotrichum orchidophilum TaxID=1209926 RepID=A0A1G4BM81_9PEZI|nr:uncharacterized protein CORC01_02410 [Colletotrichum orchidophilum]OHF02417.1 hypothetical protein CORC01_02410 [Colletotrichum orchidophilum]
MYRIVLALYRCRRSWPCVVEDVDIKAIYTSGLGLEDTSSNARFVRNCERTANGRGEVSPPPAGLCPVTFIPIPFFFFTIFMAWSCPALPCPIQTFCCLFHLSCPILSHSALSPFIPTHPILVSPARSLDQSFDQRRALSRFPIAPAFPNRPDVCPSSTPSCLVCLWRVPILPPSSSFSTPHPSRIRTVP